MAKLGKQKLHLTGSYMAGRTTYRGDVELYLYYNTEKDYFYFDVQEMKKYIGDAAPQHGGFFSDCDTKEKALNKFQSLIKEEVTETRMIRIKIGMPSRIWKVPNPEYDKSNETHRMFSEERIPNPALPDYLLKMLDKGSCYSKSGLTLEFERVMKVEVNGIMYYAACKENWSYDRTSLSSYSEGLIDWNEPLETFLMKTQDNIDALCLIVLNFFNAGKDISSLMDRINKDQKLLG